MEQTITPGHQYIKLMAGHRDPLLRILLQRCSHDGIHHSVNEFCSCGWMADQTVKRVVVNHWLHLTPPMTKPDIVYVVRPGEKNEELRYSIRSVVANLPHGKVWISGYCPKWLAGVGHINPGIKPGGHVSAKANLRAACEHPEVSEEFVYMNDDFFVMQPLEQMPVMHRGPLAEVVRTERMASSYQRAMGKTLAILIKQGIEEPMMYDLHGPMLVTKTGMLAALALCSYPMIQERTMYGNLAAIGGELRRNHKIRRQDNGWKAWPFLSTNDNTFRTLPVGEHIRARFSKPSSYETEPPQSLRTAPARIARRPIRRTAASTIRRIQVRA